MIEIKMVKQKKSKALKYYQTLHLKLLLCRVFFRDLWQKYWSILLIEILLISVSDQRVNKEFAIS